MDRQEEVLVTFECDNASTYPEKQSAVDEEMALDDVAEDTTVGEDRTAATDALSYTEVDSGCSSSVETVDSTDDLTGKVSNVEEIALVEAAAPAIESTQQDEEEVDVDDEIDLDALNVDEASEASEEDVFNTERGTQSLEESFGESLDLDDRDNVPALPPLKTPDADVGPLPSIPRPVTKSILRQESLTEDIPVSTRRASWKQLPVPDMKTIKRAVSCPDAVLPQEEKPSRRKSSVSFKEVCIRHYDQTIGDNPSCSYGPPISLDWQYESAPPLAIDEYEGDRGTRRKLRNMVLSYYSRKNVLSFVYDHSEDELKQATKEVNRVKRNRALTNALLPTAKMEEVFQSAARKSKRMLGKKDT